MAAIAMPVPEWSTPPMSHAPETVSVVLCAFAEERWSDIGRCIASLEGQSRRPDQVVVVIDHNDPFLERAADHFAVHEGSIPVDVVANPLQRGLSGARNAGVPWCDGDVVVFLDEDAGEPGRYWLATMMEDYSDPLVAGVAGGAAPSWDGAEAPTWFPPEFGWVVGCCNMSFRREVFAEIGGFGRLGRESTLGEEIEYYLRLRKRFAAARVVFDRDLEIPHRLTSDEATFKNFRSRCWHEGLSNAVVTAGVGPDDGFASQRASLARTLPSGITRGLGDGLRGRIGGFQQAGATAVGLAWAAAGYTRGRIGKSA